MKRRILALEQLQQNGMTLGKALADAIGVTTKNLAATMNPLVSSGAVRKRYDARTHASSYTLTKRGKDLLASYRPPVTKPRFDPADPFGLLAKLHASRTALTHRSHS